MGSQYLSSTSNVIILNGTGAEYSSANKFSEDAPTTSVVILGDADETNKLSDSFVSYCFASIEGYSKVGSYVGNGNSDGSFVYTGFRPAYIMFKRYDTDESWGLYDDKRPGYNVTPNRLYADSNATEVTTSTSQIDILSNGFKARSTGGVVNATSGDYLYLAFAKSPFKYSNAR